MEIEEAFIIELGAIQGLNNKVFPSTAQQGTLSPYLIYQLSSSERGEVLDLGHDGPIEAHYQLDFYHTSFSNLNDLKKLILAEIKTWNFTNLGIQGPYIQQATIIDYSYSYDGESKFYVGTIELQINYTE